ncbi:hypothetical protein LTS15_009265 [Exophiala xenobiotica]|nr:hypothetical protein LTS15_009265 [Exophiala xenobiotica]
MGPPPVRCEAMSHSTFYTMIPSAVRSRIPVLDSLRRSAKAVVLQTSSPERNARPLSCLNARNEKEFYGFAVTAPSSGASTPMIRPETPDGQLSTQDLSLRTLPQPETSTGVDWDVAATGIRLWVTAKTQAEQGGDRIALRSMHIDALRYMHMALPETLTPFEIESLRSSMSPQLLSQPSETAPAARHQHPSLLRQGVARVVCWLIAGVLLLLPIIMAFLNRIMQYERQHQVTEKFLANGLDLTSALGERSVELQRALTRFKDGRLGGACVDAGSWLVEGILGGVNDGVDAIAQSRRRAS